MKQVRWIPIAALVGMALSMSSTPALAKGYKVGPGLAFTSIQAAVDAASDGDKITVMPGTYQEVNGNIAAVTINKAIKLSAKSKKAPVIIVPNPGQNHGILAEGSEGAHIASLEISGFTVQGFPKNGIWLRYVDNFKVNGNTSIDNLENGIWPTLSANGEVRRNVSYGSDDSALWVEASTDVRVSENELYDSVTGLEVTISSNVTMSKNDVHDNTVGVGLYHPNGAGMDIPPGLVPGNWLLSDNHVYNNNRENSASPSSLAGSIPPGGGVLVLGVDNVVADSNVVENNNFYGFAVVTYCAAVDGSGNACDKVPPITQGMPELNFFRNNVLNTNGLSPVIGHPLASYAADFTYIVTDIFDPSPAPPYKINKVCGTTPSNFTKSGIGTPIYASKC